MQESLTSLESSSHRPPPHQIPITTTIIPIPSSPS
ncbi:unnamed protein product [Linum tenue]|uniref:Uncharacterized protein n=1 Tax=Linum tenue TaxID=586396 RepID=A0AAV0NI67_9ROSI|nr:unnamed protein product [Linum tenue]